MSVTLSLSLHNTPRPYIVPIRATTNDQLVRRVASAIEAFARKRGVSTLAVDYEIDRHR